MRVKRCQRCKINYTSLRVEPCCKCKGSLVDHLETAEEVQKRMTKDKPVIQGFNPVKFFISIVMWVFVIPSVCVCVFYFIKYVIQDGMHISQFTNSLGDFSYHVVIDFYKNIYIQIGSMFES